MTSLRWFVICAVLVIYCGITTAKEKRIRLEDIEQDNLKSEADLMTRGQYLKPPSIDAEQTADYGPPQQEYSKKQYAVEEDSSTDTPAAAYGSNALYLAVEQGKDLAQQATSSPHGSLQGTYLGYVPAMAMHLVYIPQVDVSSGNNEINYPKQYPNSVPAIVYQPIVSQSYQYGGQRVQYQSDDKEYHKTSQDTAYVQEPESESQHTTDYDQSNYVLVPQSYQQDSQVSYAKYEEPQQQQQQYAAYASQQYQVDDNSITQNHAYAQDDQPPSAAYKTITPKYVQPPKQVTKITPPPAAFYTSNSEKTGDTPRVLSEHAHGISRPIYSHISGNLVQDNYNQNYKGYSNYYPSGNYLPQTSTIYGTYKPKSLLDSYIPSSLQVEYLKRGLSKEPLATYDLIANSRTYRLEGGFLPNHVYSTGNGGVVYEQYKRSTKSEA